MMKIHNNFFLKFFFNEKKIQPTIQLVEELNQLRLN